MFKYVTVLYHINDFLSFTKYLLRVVFNNEAKAVVAKCGGQFCFQGTSDNIWKHLVVTVGREVTIGIWRVNIKCSRSALQQRTAQPQRPIMPREEIWNKHIRLIYRGRKLEKEHLLGR